MRRDARLSLALGLLEREPRLETELDPNLSLLGGALVWRGWGTQGTVGPAGCKSAGIEALFFRIERGAPVRA